MRDLNTQPHVRFNPLRGEWVLVSPQRNTRPWQGQVERVHDQDPPAHDPNCYLCPRKHAVRRTGEPRLPLDLRLRQRLSGAARRHAARVDQAVGGLLIARAETGVCRVVCFSPRHDLTLARMDRHALRGVVDVWVDETRAIGAEPGINYVQVFENRGAAMGASNPHPHGQIWATATIPNEPRANRRPSPRIARPRARASCATISRSSGRAASAWSARTRHFIAVVPFWAVWPFETLVLPRRHVAGLDGLTSAERDALADMLKRLTTRYDNLFETPFPYSMGFHQQPCDGGAHDEWHLHAHFYPPLLRSATVRKFMVGFEMLGMPQRDMTPEDAAARLRAASQEHYRDR